MSRWKPRHLLGAWSAYWAGLGLVTLGPAVLSILRVTVPAGAKGSVSATFDNTMFHLVVKSGETTLWSGSAEAMSMALWIALPPLALWLTWLAVRPSRRGDVEVGDESTRLLRDAPLPLHDRERPREERVDRD